MLTPEVVKEYMFKNFLGEVVSDGKEYNMNSPFVEDNRKKFWMNLNTGRWQCFASHQSGNFTKFISKTTHQDYSKVESDLLYKTFFNSTPRFLEEEKIKESYLVPDEILNTFREISLSSQDNVIKFLFSRKLIATHKYWPTHVHNKFYYCEAGLYKGRFIIPYFEDNFNGEGMYYFQARALNPDQNPKYLNYKGKKSSHILYPYNDNETDLFITEGALDARSLQIQGRNATSTLSCSISHVQLDELKNYKGRLVVAYDNDIAGLEGLIRFYRLSKEHLIPKIYYCPPPPEFKDWNEAHVAGRSLKEYMNIKTVEVDELLIQSKIHSGRDTSFT